jgi:hypothetical protein
MVAKVGCERQATSGKRCSLIAARYSLLAIRSLFNRQKRRGAQRNAKGIQMWFAVRLIVNTRFDSALSLKMAKHFPIFTFSHLHIFTFSHFHIFTFAHLHIFTFFKWT